MVDLSWQDEIIEYKNIQKELEEDAAIRYQYSKYRIASFWDNINTFNNSLDENARLSYSESTTNASRILQSNYLNRYDILKYDRELNISHESSNNPYPNTRTIFGYWHSWFEYDHMCDTIILKYQTNDGVSDYLIREDDIPIIVRNMCMGHKYKLIDGLTEKIIENKNL